MQDEFTQRTKDQEDEHPAEPVHQEQTRSAGVQPSRSPMHRADASTDASVCLAPLGSAVVPDV